MQSTFDSDLDSKLHVAMIMDGNGRWAQSRGYPRIEGHRKGMGTVRKVVEAAPELGVGTLTLYAFSSDNWKRPPSEVDALMRLFQLYLKKEVAKCIENGVRLSVIGRRDRFSERLQGAIARAEKTSQHCTTLHLRIAADYSARDMILRAAKNFHDDTKASREQFSRYLSGDLHTGEPSPDVDLLIRTGGEQRLSDFLLWECAYAELFFMPKMWPDFSKPDFARAVADFKHRERRFGEVPVANAA
ncbi:MAG: di-trans,poly-cis-decaprenylcistransferase [bacterium]